MVTKRSGLCFERDFCVRSGSLGDGLALENQSQGSVFAAMSGPLPPLLLLLQTTGVDINY